MILTQVAFVVLGLVVLLGGGEFLVRGAVALAKQLRVPALLIGLTIVAFGTSAPELVVSVQAVFSGDNGIAIGNIVGSNIANIFLVLGVPALVAPIAMSSPGLGRHGVVMMLASILFAYVVYQMGVLSTSTGALFVALITLYVGYVGYSAAKQGEDAELLEEVDELCDDDIDGKKTLFYVVAGLVGLPLGGWLLVTYGAQLAASLGVRQELIGLTVVAFGTSLPELATVWAAAMKREADVAVGNIVGSNIFNLLFVGGAIGLAGTTRFDDSVALKTFDIPVMMMAAVVLALMIFARTTITRVVGLLFTIIYLGYVGFIGSQGLAG